MQCEVRSFKCDLCNSAPLSHKARTHGPGWLTAHASSIESLDEKGLIDTPLLVRKWIQMVHSQMLTAGKSDARTFIQSTKKFQISGKPTCHLIKLSEHGASSGVRTVSQPSRAMCGSCTSNRSTVAWLEVSRRY